MAVRPGEAAAISAPVLAVVGTETDRWFADSNELLHSLLSQAQVEDCRIDGVAHLLHMQRPAPVARGMAEFFARHPIAGDQRGAQRAGLGTRRVGTTGRTDPEPAHGMSPIASA